MIHYPGYSKRIRIFVSLAFSYKPLPVICYFTKFVQILRALAFELFSYSATYYFLYFLASETNVSEDDIIRIHDNHGNTMELLGSGGQYLSASSVRSGRYPNPVTNIPRLRKMNVNEDDIFLCAYPKAGMV